MSVRLSQIIYRDLICSPLLSAFPFTNPGFVCKEHNCHAV